LSTLSTENVRVHKDEVYFKFIGKSNAENTATVEDKELARLLEKKIGEAVERNKAESREITVSFYDKQGTKKYLEKRIKTNFLFTVSDEEVEQYFKQNLGKEFKVKDLRTAAANRVAKKSLGEGEVPKNKKELESKLKEMYAEVARTLNNTLSVAKSSYVDPKVVENYVNKVIKQWERKKK
jgi:DNA topoisomerase-1